MPSRRFLSALLALSFPLFLRAQAPAGGGAPRPFSVAVYIPVTTVRHLADPAVLQAEWQRISSQVRVDRVYIEAERSRVLADDATLERVKAFFVARGVRVAGGITFSDGEQDGQFRSFCYTDPADRAFVRQASELVARHFDEVILDDFFFVTTKYESDIAAKGGRSWTQFRLDLMDEAGRNLVVGAMKAVNPRVRVTIKYPNWYEHFQGLGFDLAQGPKIFDGIYTGTETRDPNSTDQYLQQYESYQIVRYFENIAPGRNGGGWVDTFDLRYVDRYAEQLWDTALAKAREVTLFSWTGLLAPLRAGDRAAWSGQATRFDLDRMLRYHPPGVAADARPPTMARAAGYALEQVAGVVGRLGRPIGIASYRPPHGLGEDFLHNYFGMIGIPVDLRPEFPDQAPVVLLTEDAQTDPDLVGRIQRRLRAGGTVVITSGLARALQGRGLEQMVELEFSGRRILADGYSTGEGAGGRVLLPGAAQGRPPVLFPQVGFLTNDAWARVSAMSDGVGYPLLLEDRYGNHGRLYVWTIPDDFHNLYSLPPEVIRAVKDVVMEGFPVRLDGPSQVALFAYDNRTFVLESYRPEPEEVEVTVSGPSGRLRELDGAEIPPGETRASPYPGGAPVHRFRLVLLPHSFRAFALEP